MKLGRFLVIAGSVVVVWFIVFPLVSIIDKWISGIGINWATLGRSLAIGILGGGILLMIGQKRIKNAKERGKSSDSI